MGLWEPPTEQTLGSYAAKARELRAMAVRARDLEARELLFSTAAQYDELAARLRVACGRSR